MTKLQLTKYIIEKKRHPLSIDDYTNFFVLLLPPVFSVLGAFMIWTYFNRVNVPVWLCLLGFILVPSGLLFLYFSIVRVKQNFTFYVINNHHKPDIDQIAKLISENFRLEDIRIDKKLQQLTAETRMTAFSWGERITIIINDFEVLINSRPVSSRQPFTIMKDANNIRIIRKLIED